MKKTERSPWSWIPTLYFAEGLPYIIIMTVSVIMYKRMDVSNSDIALYTSWLYLPWVLKFLWSPVVDLLKTKRSWILAMQLIIGAGLGCVALTLPLPGFFKMSLGVFWLLAFSSATHDIAIDGFYMLGLSQHKQAWFVGIRSIFYRLAMLTGQGILIIFVGYLEGVTGLPEVKVEITSTRASIESAWTHPDSIKFKSLSNDLSIMVYPENLQIPIKTSCKSEIDSVLRFVNNWNRANGFFNEKISSTTKKSTRAGLSQRKDNWLETWLHNNFGQNSQTPPSETAGSVGLIYFKLSDMPATETINFHFGMISGNKSIYLRSEPWAGGRLTINKDNWDKPAIAVIQLDEKLDHIVSAKFSGRSGNIPLSWSVTFVILGILFIIFFFYHIKILPYPETDKPTAIESMGRFITEFWTTFKSFFTKEHIIASILFLLLYRLAESQLVKLASPFLLDSREAGGLALTTGQVGFVYGTVGLIGLIIGGAAGGILAARHGLKFWLWPMAIAINLPNAVYIYLSSAMPDSFFLINLCVLIEQFGYGFGFTAFMLYMIYVSRGKHKTAHFAITTAFMALGMMIPGMFSGWLQEIIGYTSFFTWVMISTIPSFIILFYLKIDKGFGRKV